ncbi:MAG: hypothetical protein U1E87_04280 [Alphaproteobacteria bacterium]
MRAKTVLGIIGGSGLYDVPGFQSTRWSRVKSPWGETSRRVSARTLKASISCSCRGTGAATGTAPRRSITAPISTP